MPKEKELLATKTYTFVVTTVVRARDFKEAINNRQFGKVINIGLSQDEELDEYD